MFSSLKSSPQLYQTLETQCLVDQAKPLGLVVMLYDGAIRSIHEARAAMQRGDRKAKGHAISKALRIIEEGLRASLDHGVGEMSKNLGDLYIYINSRLLSAHLRDDEAALAEALDLLRPLRDAWQAIEKSH